MLLDVLSDWWWFHTQRDGKRRGQREVEKLRAVGLNRRKDSQRQRFTFSPFHDKQAAQPFSKDGVSKDPPKTSPEWSYFSLSRLSGEQIISLFLTVFTLGRNVLCTAPNTRFWSECPEITGTTISTFGSCDVCECEWETNNYVNWNQSRYLKFSV